MSASTLIIGLLLGAMANEVTADRAAPVGNHVPFAATGTTTARTPADRAADVVNVKDFGARGDGTTNDAAAIQAAINSGGERIVFPGPATWLVASGLDLSGKTHRMLDLGGGTLRYAGSGTLLDLTAAGGITIRNGTIATTNPAAVAVATAGAAAAQATTYPTVPPESRWSRWLRFENLTVSGFGTAFQLGNFTREVWITDSIVTDNARAISATGKVANLYVKSSVLYSRRPSSQAVVVRGDPGDASWRFAEGLQFNDIIADVSGTALDVRDVHMFRWSGGQIRSAVGTVGVALTKGVTPLTRDVKITDAMIQAQVNIGAGLTSGFQFATHLANVNFNAIQDTALVLGSHTKGVEVLGASFDAPSGTPVAISVGANAVNVRLNGLNIDGAYATGVTIDPTSIAGVKGHYSAAWTPALAFGGGNTGVVYGVRSGHYWVMDGLVFGTFQIALRQKGSSAGPATITGLPFPARGAGTATIGRFAGFNASWNPVLDVPAGGTVINLKNGGAGSEAILSSSDFSNSSTLSGSFVYPVAE